MVNYKKQLIVVANWLIMGLIVLLWVRFILHDDSRSLGSGMTTSSISHSQDSLNNGSIEQYHIFGSAQRLYDIPLNQGQTSLDLILNGTMSSSNKTSGMAYISSVQGIQKKFKVGDKVFKVATLKEIHRNYVVLNHNGRDERLSLNKKDVVINTRVKGKAKSNKSKPAFLKHLNGSEQRNWQEMIEQQKFDPNKISNIVGNISMVTDQTGAIQGLRVSNLAQGNLLKKHGLRANDIITAVNGNKISGKNMLTIKQTLTQNPNATITIKRNGKVQNIKVNLSDL
ncbi:MAG: PDZ domain-containing protein [Alcanivoracaceae bacterium]|nr:PDZ domain-containing protein [Alcanivoracaceae bacterium]